MAPGFPTADEPHEYLGKIVVKVDYAYPISPPTGAAAAQVMAEIEAEQVARARAAAAARGGNAIALMHSDLPDTSERWLDQRSCEGRCYRNTFAYNVLKLSAAEHPPSDGATRLGGLVPPGYRAVGHGRLAGEVALTVTRYRCYALGMAIPNGGQRRAAVRLEGLMAGGQMADGNVFDVRFDLDPVFQPAQLRELGCAAATETQRRPVAVASLDAPEVEWTLFERELGAAAGVRALCDQCAGVATRCGGVAYAACRPLGQCLTARALRSDQCRY